MGTSLETAFVELDGFTGRIPGDRLRAWIENCSFSLDDVGTFSRFHPDHYLRNLLHDGPSYHALVLCWRNGQRSPIHDHRGSGCAVKVLSGEAIETRYERAPNGMAYPVSSRVLTAGSACYSEDADIHQVSNLQAQGADLVTLHLYSPPLFRMNVYSLYGETVRDFFDPVNDEFSSGAGI